MYILYVFTLFDPKAPLLISRFENLLVELSRNKHLLQYYDYTAQLCDLYETKNVPWIISLYF